MASEELRSTLDMRRALALVAERPRDLFELLYRAADREAAKQRLIERW